MCDFKSYEPHREKTYLLTRESNADLYQTAWIRVFVVRMKTFDILSHRKAPSDDSDQTANVQAALNLSTAQMSEGTFSDVVAPMPLVYYENMPIQIYRKFHF